ncbi:MAG: hypothetical protein IJU86_02355 [Firmicutes bacterium]|nr:hypothetical protein [Bacillota bacterium]
MPDNKFEKVIHALDSTRIKYYDDEINTPELKFIKAIVPYIDFKYQKQIAGMVKIFEFEMLMNLYTQKKNNDEDEKNNFEIGLINAMKTFLPANYFGLIKNIFMIFYRDQNKNLNLQGEKNFMEDIFNETAFKNLEPENQELIKNFIRDINGKSPMESANIIMEYNKKIPKNITEEQKNEIINLLLKRMSPEKKQQFLDFYSMFMKK